jgi:tryptophan synthase beta chain
MYTLGHGFVPPKIHAGGLRYHGMAPLVSLMVKAGAMEAVAVHQNPAFDAAVLFARTEGIIPAPETAHAIRVAVDEALTCRQTGESKAILFNFSGHGHFDLAAYEQYFSKSLEDYEYPEALIREALKDVPAVP